ncbi:MAG: phosphoenolpyruvate carboxykinase (ATP) [Gemmataceae bacterium]|nr:phosphoenolpyruvate carboxykinase (ATP) [Gemmataceae bacterium]
MDLSAHGLVNLGAVHAQLAPAHWIEMALARKEGVLAASGVFVAVTTPYTGRAAKDKYIVRRPGNETQLAFGSVNQPMDPVNFERLWSRAQTHYQKRETFVFDGWACADPTYRIGVRVISENAWHAMFAQCLLRRPSPGEPIAPELVILHAPSLKLDPARDQTRSDIAVILDMEGHRVLIAGTAYAGEIKKSVFTYLNYWMPTRNVFPMHCSATVGSAGDTALLFGLSGTGKTTLSADPERKLIGDDEHGWSAQGVFNFEGGCYAKCIKLSQSGEPQIWNAIRFGSILENVVLDEQTRVPNFDDATLTENTRAAYPLDLIDNIEPTSVGGHPANLLFLACDAFGILPPLSKLTPAQAQYHFLSGYTAKIGGTEAGVKEPTATFSSCFGAPFLPRPAVEYAKLLEQRIAAHGAPVWLVNTGWTGGPYGVGRRFPLDLTRRLVRAALSGELSAATFAPDPVFGFSVPTACPGVPTQLLQPCGAWTDGAAYDRQARQLVELFQKNFKTYEGQASADVKAAGPR